MTLLRKADDRGEGWISWEVGAGCIGYDGSSWFIHDGDGHVEYLLTRDEARTALQNAGFLDANGRATR